MKLHLKRTTRALERILVTVEAEVLDAKFMAAADMKAWEEAQALRLSMPLSQRAPIALVRKIEKLKTRAQHAEYLWDKACEARNALRSLIAAGQVEL